MRLSLCVPMYNESAIAAETAKIYSDALQGLTGGDYELIFSDDGSSDGCADIIRAIKDEHIKVVGYKQNRGKGCAVRTAVMAAQGDVILYTDCDNAYGTDKIGEALGIMERDKDADAVVGSRNIGSDGYEGYTFLRKLMSKTYIRVLKICAGFKMSDSQCGFKAFRKKAAHDIFSRCQTDGFAFDIEVLLFAQSLGYNVKEMPICVINRRETESKVHIIKDTLRMLRDLSKIKKHVKSAVKYCNILA